MQPLRVDDLMSLEEYHRKRAAFRAEVLEHKKHRQVPLGANATLYFEDRLTIQYQVQEMLRIERIFEADAIAEELGAYNPLIPDGTNLKATLMIEFPDVAERRAALVRLAGIEDAVYADVEGFEPISAIADEDLERSDPDKTTAVHFLRFELEPDAIDALRRGATLAFGCSHPGYRERTVVGDAIRDALLADFD